MVAGDTKKIVVIKNISSNLIEEAIFILRNEPGTKGDGEAEKPSGSISGMKNDFILKEAESIINQYIKENGLTVACGRRPFPGRKISHIRISVNALINCLLIAAAAFLIYVVYKAI